MADENTTVILGIPIPSDDPVFLGIVGVHIVFGLAAVITGAVAMLSNKGRGRHSNFGTIYFWCLSGVFVREPPRRTATALWRAHSTARRCGLNRAAAEQF